MPNAFLRGNRKNAAGWKSVRGLTLAEMLVTISVMVILGGVVISLYLGSGQFNQAEQLRIDVDVSASRVLTRLDQNLRQGNKVESQYPLTGPPTYVTGSTVLVFSMPSIVSGAPDDLKKDTVALYLQNGDLKLMIDADPSSSRQDETLTITNNVQDIYFRYLADSPTDAKALTLTLTAVKTVAGHQYTQASILNETFHNYF